ncbi:hypothetical protein DQ04_09041000 [Trypanosoma grayi]|uniref:hypothetical protein n=1 Tax=Trypanosoma grayi TaxID=71804 RepID=UPI0004F4B109|nr:hypothetical protein DQ04_09041000 [Trypanosoma grayi]KEG07702.1 hypothetical protein DQ04_09041000 [Trypanosoma grayi]
MQNSTVQLRLATDPAAASLSVEALCTLATRFITAQEQQQQPQERKDINDGATARVGNGGDGTLQHILLCDVLADTAQCCGTPLPREQKQQEDQKPTENWTTASCALHASLGSPVELRQQSFNAMLARDAFVLLLREVHAQRMVANSYKRKYTNAMESLRLAEREALAVCNEETQLSGDKKDGGQQEHQQQKQQASSASQVDGGDAYHGDTQLTDGSLVVAGLNDHAASPKQLCAAARRRHRCFRRLGGALHRARVGFRKAQRGRSLSASGSARNSRGDWLASVSSSTTIGGEMSWHVQSRSSGDELPALARSSAGTLKRSRVRCSSCSCAPAVARSALGSLLWPARTAAVEAASAYAHSALQEYGDDSRGSSSGRPSLRHVSASYSQTCFGVSLSRSASPRWRSTTPDNQLLQSSRHEGRSSDKSSSNSDSDTTADISSVQLAVNAQLRQWRLEASRMSDELLGRVPHP